MIKFKKQVVSTLWAAEILGGQEKKSVVKTLGWGSKMLFMFYLFKI